VQVLAKHHPGLSVHSDVRDLDLAAAVGNSIIEAVVISTPCVDLSSRGLGQAQLGQVLASTLPLGVPVALKQLPRGRLCAGVKPLLHGT
jgi:hypothetical protein